MPDDRDLAILALGQKIAKARAALSSANEEIEHAATLLGPWDSLSKDDKAARMHLDAASDAIDVALAALAQPVASRKVK